MNSFFLYSIFLILLLTPLSVSSQVGLNSSDPISPLNLLDDPSDSRRFIKLNYISPYGITSLSDFGIRYNQPVFRGSIVSGVNVLGIRGYYQYNFELGYTLLLNPDFQLGLIINADMSPSCMSEPYRFSLGSSIYSHYNYENRILCNIYLDHWTDLLLSDTYTGRDARFSFSSRFITNNDVNIIAALLYAKGRMPLLRFGISILADSSHTIMSGMQTGPIGFWLGYKFSADRLDFIFSMQTSGIFGYEPGSSFKYLLK